MSDSRLEHHSTSHAFLILGVIAAFLWSIIRSGAAMLSAPEVGVQAALAWPQRLDGEFQAFISDSPVGLLTFKALGTTSPQVWMWMHAVTAITVIVIFGLWALVSATRGTRAESARLALLAPVATVVLTGIGSYDPFTLLAMSLILFSLLGRSRIIVAISGIFLGFQHFEQGLLGLLALVLVWLALRSQLPLSISRVNPAWALIGLLLGRLFLALIFSINNVSPSGRPQWIEEFLVDWTSTAAATAPLLLWSLFAGTWGIVLYMWMGSTAFKSRLMLLGAFGFGVLGLLVSGDRPRVFIVVLAPALLLLVLAYTSLEARPVATRRVLEILVWIAPPIVFAESVITNVNIVDVPYSLFLYLTS